MAQLSVVKSFSYHSSLVYYLPVSPHITGSKLYIRKIKLRTFLHSASKHTLAKQRFDLWEDNSCAILMPVCLIYLARWWLLPAMLIYLSTTGCIVSSIYLLRGDLLCVSLTNQSRILVSTSSGSATISRPTITCIITSSIQKGHCKFHCEMAQGMSSSISYLWQMDNRKPSEKYYIACLYRYLNYNVSLLLLKKRNIFHYILD